MKTPEYTTELLSRGNTTEPWVAIDVSGYATHEEALDVFSALAATLPTMVNASGEPTEYACRMLKNGIEVSRCGADRPDVT
jgi:hypothetical protein